MESMERTGRTDATEYTTIGAFRSANVHLTSCCNYRCGFCFSTKLDKRWLSANEWVPILEKLRHSGICKINYAGGEPFLYPEIVELCKVSKRMGFMVSVVSNASLIDEDVLSDLEGSLDWLGLSVDSISEDTERKLGRGCNGGNHIENVVSVADMAHHHKISVKLNITVVRQSVEDDFTDLICRIDPQRVKVFQMLSLRNVNPDADALYGVTDEEFESFRKRHSEIVLSNGDSLIFEDNDVMEGSYLMLDPLGRVMTNSRKILKLQNLDYLSGHWSDILDDWKYILRDGLYFTK